MQLARHSSFLLHTRLTPASSLFVAIRRRPSPAAKLSSTVRTMAQTDAQMRFKNPALFVCDLQEKFRNAIYEFDKVVTTTEKLLAFAKAASIPVRVTTQTVAKLGPTVPSIAAHLTSITPVDKTRFSMAVPEVVAGLAPGSQVALVGIESHICITQTALDLRDAGHHVYVLADGVSSCNRQEVVVALDRLRAEDGVSVTSSESWMYECLGDASHPAFKPLIAIVKGAGDNTKKVLESLPPMPKI
ncbi:isochorismatase domain-containing protein 2A [Cordyceps fumosorosea ARSEF 2679]|uniref:Isochorismatase domain-containing protein 2A n=1 Tax=Cordyceps fumosorosea (strain ARSEF 2679) TaxID=1081104 RepID=A0A168B0C6_CORFA|nr:isochorismatase domain-containing protein 2A [Cordyceps fumosorosea ARSEF 2679]OAA69440.1 isochorismatase domain-containing protein 2A [Cordyceps fumosorosea ARSEF 2679]